jgi:hypothetical protein
MMMKGHLCWRVLCAVFSLVVLVAVSASCWAAPSIVEYRIEHVTFVRSLYPSGEPSPRWAALIGVQIEDAGDAAGVTVYGPDGGPHPGDPVCFPEEGHVCYCAAWEESYPLSTGQYTLVVHLTHGPDLEPATTQPVTHFPEPVPEITYPLPGAVIEETVPLFTWLPYPGFACHGNAPAEWQSVAVTTPDEATLLWSIGLPPEDTSVLYGTDAEWPPPLEPGQSYMIQLWEVSWPTFLAGDPPGYLVESTRQDSTFHVSGPPTIVGYVVKHSALERSAYPDGDCYPTWARAVGVQARDVSGPASIAGLTVWDPAGDPLPSDYSFRMEQPDGTVCFCTPWEDLTVPPVGSYTLVAHDADGSDSEPVVTAPVDHFPYPVPEISYPAPGSVIAESTPLFEWLPYPGFACEGDAPAEVQFVHVSSPDEALSLWSQYLPPEDTCALYGSDGEPVPALEAGQSYMVQLWQIGPSILLEEGDVWGYRLEETRRDCIFWVEPKFVGFLRPINNDGSSIFKLNSTVPVKFQLLNADGSYKGDAVATLSVAKVEDDVLGEHMEAASTAPPDNGSTFRYDPAANQYVLNLGTRGMSVGTWSLQVTLDGVLAKEVLISLD